MTGQRPVFSVVIPTCDRPEELKAAVQSVWGQSLAAHEIIIIDNGLEAVQASALPSGDTIRLIRALPRFGVAQARNMGAVLASGTHIAFLDDDDGWSEGYLEAANRTFLETDAAFTLAPLRDRASGLPLPGKQALFASPRDLKAQLMVRNPGAGGSNLIVLKELFLKTSGFDPALPTGEDRDLILALLSCGGVPARVEGGWSIVRDGADRPRLSDRTLAGKWAFIKKNGSLMTGWQRLLNLKSLLHLFLLGLAGKK